MEVVDAFKVEDMPTLKPLDLPEDKMTEYLCYNRTKSITLSWSRLNDWAKCHHRVKLMHLGYRTKIVNARNFLAGNVTDNTMRKALQQANRDDEGRLLSFSMDEMLAPLEETWNSALGTQEENRVLQWTGDPLKDQHRLLAKSKLTLEKLHPIIEKNVVGRRFVPEFRPKVMPAIGIPGPYGEPCYIRLFLAVDIAVQVREDPDNPDGVGDWGLFDLKTTDKVEYINKTLPQLVFYDIAFNALTGKRPTEHALWAPLLDPAVKTIQVEDSHRAMVMNWIVSYCHGVWAGKEGFTTDDSNCFNCPTKAACPKFIKPITKDEQGISRVHFGTSKKEGMLHG